ncbi:hypothetical protein K8089_05150 [Aequorivita sp. F47161]|uniref:Uncharacterized protein n=1 Tax=Aequorivita vitellina TaxID=2874475 RepID=A0A9X1QVY6_9FLAO|nr:hypothetical protein [Aequorivita vitellina]MCG2418402.1 hypothetical protein [Aequorivita vitellina]
MASKNGFPPIVGTYNGINYYIRKGKQCQRKAGGGFTSESIKNNPKMQGIRDRNKEMTLCSKFTKKFKDAMFPFFKEIEDGELHQRLMQLFMEIRTYDETLEGKRIAGRGLNCDMGRELLSEFRFTQGPNSWDIFGSGVAFDTNTGVLKASSFDPQRLKFPKGSTHFFINYGVLEYDLKNDSFRFIIAEETLVVAKEDEARELVLEVGEMPKKGSLIFGVVKVQFHQKSSDKFYKSFAKGAVGIGVV